MGQVSILEDIDKAAEGLAQLLAKSTPPTDAALVAQERRLDKHWAVLRERAAELLDLAKAIRGGKVTGASRRWARILEIEASVAARKRLEQDVRDLKAEAKALKFRKETTDDLVARAELLRTIIETQERHGGLSKALLNDILNTRLANLAVRCSQGSAFTRELERTRKERDAFRAKFIRCDTERQRLAKALRAQQSRSSE